MAMRGRHFRISLAMCAVSYTTLPKRARRSLDTLLVPGHHVRYWLIKFIPYSVFSTNSNVAWDKNSIPKWYAITSEA